MMPSRRYCIVSPCRDEAKFVTRTLETVAAQAVLPVRWVIVDDGSTDQTPELLRDFARDRPWIHVMRREDRGARKVGPGVVDAFYVGYEAVRSMDWEYVCKLDMDLELPPSYFATLMSHMEADPRLGSVSGEAYFRREGSGELVSEGISREMSVGASKFCRRRCFEQIGGFVRQVMWDGIDCHRARMLGWRVASLPDPAARFVHLRPMGSSHRGIWNGRRRHGFGQYFMGTDFVYMCVSSLYRMTRPPLLVGGLAMWWGYVSSWLRGEARLEDPEFRRFLRRFQWSMLTRGKARATRRVESAQASAWLPDRRSRWEV